MSIETVLIFLLFIVVPLVQQWLEARRQAGGESAPADAAPERVRPTRARPPHVRPPRIPAEASPQRPATPPLPPAAAVVPRLRPQPRGRGKGGELRAAPVGAPRSTRRPRVNLRQRGSLQRAIVTMTILGPNRADRPHDTGQ